MNRYERMCGHPKGMPLTDRQRYVVTAIAHGLTNQEIADELGLSLETIRYYRSAAYRRLGVHTSSQAVRAAVRLGIL